MKKISTNLILLVTLVFFLPACLTSKKFDDQVAQQYRDAPEPKKKKQVDNISVTSPLTSTDGKISTTETKTSHMLPLLLYWQWDYRNTCTLNPQIPINNFTTTVLSYAGKKLKDKITGQQLELSVVKIPHKFALIDKAHLVFFGYAVGWDNVYIKAENMEMIVNYRLLKDNNEIKTGSISIPNFDDKKPLGMFKSWRTATTEYLEQFDANITTMSKLVVDKLNEEL